MERLRIPGLIGLIVGGYLNGPDALDLIDADSLRARHDRSCST